MDDPLEAGHGARAGNVEIRLAVAAALLAAILCMIAPLIFDREAVKIAGEVAQLLAFVVGVPAAVVAVLNHRRSVEAHRDAVRERVRALSWKQKEFVAARFDRLQASPNCKIAMRLLDYNATRVTLPGSTTELPLNDLTVMSALAPRNQRGIYSDEQVHIRDAFDEFFDELDRLGMMARSGLIREADLGPYIGYWLKLFDHRQRERPEVYSAILRRYVAKFDFEDLAALLKSKSLMDPGNEAERDRDDNLIKEFGETQGEDWSAPANAPWADRIKPLARG